MPKMAVVKGGNRLLLQDVKQKMYFSRSLVTTLGMREVFISLTHSYVGKCPVRARIGKRNTYYGDPKAILASPGVEAEDRDMRQKCASSLCACSLALCCN